MIIIFMDFIDQLIDLINCASLTEESVYMTASSSPTEVDFQTDQALRPSLNKKSKTEDRLYQKHKKEGSEPHVSLKISNLGTTLLMGKSDVSQSLGLSRLWFQALLGLLLRGEVLQQKRGSTPAEIGNFYSHSLPSTDSRRAVVSFWRKNVHNTCTG